jgi:putative ABC transport system permease protein
MLLVARKNLFAERTRLAISVGGVALSVLLITLLLALYRGWDEKVGGFVEDSTVDVWIASEGAKDFLAAASLLPIDDPGQQGQQVRDALDNDEGIERWSPLIVRQMEGVKVEITEEGGEKVGKEMNLQFIGYDLESGLGGPLKIVDGEGNPGADQVVVDEALRKRYGVDVGDTVKAGGKNWEVIGVSSGGDFVATQTVFVNHDEAREALAMDTQTTFVVLDMAEDADLAEWRESFVSSQPLLRGRVAIYTSNEFAQNTRDRILSNVLPILLMVLVLAFIVGLAVAGLTIYTSTVEKAREYGILKAVGFKNGYLFRTVLEQSLVTGLLGFLIGVGATFLVTVFATDLVPQFVTYLRPLDIVFVAVATLVMSAIAAYIPVRRLASIDPVAAFKG